MLYTIQNLSLNQNGPQSIVISASHEEYYVTLNFTNSTFEYTTNEGAVVEFCFVTKRWLTSTGTAPACFVKGNLVLLFRAMRAVTAASYSEQVTALRSLLAFISA